MKRGIRRHPEGRPLITLVLVCLPLHREEIGGIIGESDTQRFRPCPRTLIPRIGQRHDMLDLHGCTSLVAALEIYRRTRIRIMQHTCGHRTRTATDLHIGLLDQIAIKNVVSRIALVVSTRCVGVISPRLPVRRTAIISMTDTNWHHRYTSENINPSRHRRLIGPGHRRRPSRRHHRLHGHHNRQRCSGSRPSQPRLGHRSVPDMNSASCNVSSNTPNPPRKRVSQPLRPPGASLSSSQDSPNASRR